MYIIYKEVAETPLEALHKFRVLNDISGEERLSYIGRLDPMAEGELMIISGTENDIREKYLSYDKTYEASILLGVSTDSGDILGLITDANLDEQLINENKLSEIKKTVENFIHIKEQTYPWFSSKNVNGKALFDWYKQGQGHLIQRPKRNVNIYSVENISFSKINVELLEQTILERISKVKGDFRQTETIQKWKEFFAQNKGDFHMVNFSIKVSTGTYIRNLTEEIKKENGTNALLLNLKRTKIHI